MQLHHLVKQLMSVMMRKLISICAITALLCSTSQSPALSVNTSVAQMVRSSAIRHGVPADFALAIARHESGLRCNVTGSHGEKGPLQILPSTARALGFKNIRTASCATQIEAGMIHLSKCYRGMGGNRWLTAGCHNQGFSTISTRRLSSAARKYANSVVGVIRSASVATTKRRSTKSVVVVPVADKIARYKNNFTAGSGS